MPVRMQLLDNHLTLVRLDTLSKRAGHTPAVARTAIGERRKRDLRVAASEYLTHGRRVHRVVCEQQQPFDDIPKRANVAGPCVTDELVDGVTFEAARLPPVLLCYLP